MSPHLEFLHMTRKFSTDNVRGVRDKYQVWRCISNHFHPDPPSQPGGTAEKILIKCPFLFDLNFRDFVDIFLWIFFVERWLGLINLVSYLRALFNVTSKLPLSSARMSMFSFETSKAVAEMFHFFYMNTRR